MSANFLNFLNRNNSGQGYSARLIRIRPRINFPLTPYILKFEFHETFIPSTLSRHVATFTDRLCYSHSDRIRLASNLSLPPPPRHQRISSVTEKGDSIGSHRHPRLLPSDPLCSTICLQCVRSSSTLFSLSLSFPLSRSPIFLRSSRSRRACRFSKILDRLFRFFFSRCDIPS